MDDGIPSTSRHRIYLREDNYEDTSSKDTDSDTDSPMLDDNGGATCNTGTKRKREPEQEGSQTPMFDQSDEILYTLTAANTHRNLISNGPTRLTQAVETNDCALVRLLLERAGLDPNEVDGRGHTALTLSLSNNRYNGIANILLDWKDTDVNKVDEHGTIPLTLAVEQNNLRIVRRLLGRGANILATGTGGVTPLSRAVVLKRQSIILHMLDANEANRKTRMAVVFALMFHLSKTPIAANDCPWAIIVMDAPDVLKIVLERIFKEDRARLHRIIMAISPNGRNIFTLAVEKDAREVIDYFLSLRTLVPQFINRPDARDETALLIALRNENLNLAELLLQNGADPNATTMQTPILNVIIKKGYEEGVGLLITNRAGIDIAARKGHTPLTQAVKCGNEVAVKQLLITGVNVNLANTKGCTPLTTAIRYSQLSIASRLIMDGAAVDVCEALGDTTPLIMAVEKENAEAVHFLLNHKASVDLCNRDGYTPLTTAIKRRSEDMIELLRERGANMNFEDRNGYTPLSFATSLNRESISLYLINECGVDVNAQGWFGSTPLLNAIIHKNQVLVKALLAKGADVNVGDWKGRQPLVQAVESDCFPILKLLLEKNTYTDDGSDISLNWLKINDLKAHTPLSKAVSLNKPEVVKFLLDDANAKNHTSFGHNALIEAISCDNLAMIDLLLGNGTKITATESNGRTLLEKAMQKDNLAMIDCILKHTEVKPANILTMACAASAFNVISKYLDVWHIDINCTDTEGFTPLTKTVEANNLITLEFLIGKGVDVDKIDGNGFTAITKAVELKNFEALKLLVENRADVSKVDGNNVKPLSKAVEMDDMKIIKYIISNDKRNDDALGLKSECPVCYESLRKTQVYSTICGHMFCKNCLIAVCRNSGLCPTCRSAVGFNTIHPIFL